MNEVMMMSIRVRVRESILLVFILFHGRDISCVYILFFSMSELFCDSDCCFLRLKYFRPLFLLVFDFFAPVCIVCHAVSLFSFSQFDFLSFDRPLFANQQRHAQKIFFFYISAVSSISFRFLCSSPTTSSTYTHRCCSNIFTFGNTSEHNTHIESHSLIRCF